MHRTPREQPDLEVQVPAACLCPVLGRLSSVAPAPTPPTVTPCPRGGRSPTARARAEGPEQTPRWPEVADAAREELRAGGAQRAAWGAPVRSARLLPAAGPQDLRGPTVNPSFHRAASARLGAWRGPGRVHVASSGANQPTPSEASGNLGRGPSRRRTDQRRDYSSASRRTY